MRTESWNVARRGLALGKRGAADIEPVMLDRVEYPKTRVGGIARQEDHLDVLLFGTIEPQQLFHQHERRTGGENFLLVLDLVAMIRIDAGLRVDAMAVRQIEQCARRNGDDQL